MSTNRAPQALQIAALVTAEPGIDTATLADRITGAVGDLREHTEDAECRIDGAGRWWPITPIGNLRPGDQIPADTLHFATRDTYDWITVHHVVSDEETGECRIDTRNDQGIDSIYGYDWDEHLPIRRTA